MKILFFHGEDQITVESQKDSVRSDDSTTEFLNTDLEHAEVVDGELTVYTSGGHFYVVLTRSEVTEIVKASPEWKGLREAIYQYEIGTTNFPWKVVRRLLSQFLNLLGDRP